MVVTSKTEMLYREAQASQGLTTYAQMLCGFVKHSHLLMSAATISSLVMATAGEEEDAATAARTTTTRRPPRFMMKPAGTKADILVEIDWVANSRYCYISRVGNFKSWPINVILFVLKPSVGKRRC